MKRTQPQLIVALSQLIIEFRLYFLNLHSIGSVCSVSSYKLKVIVHVNFVVLYIILRIYILKRHYKEIEKSILHKRMMVKKLYIYILYENLKSPYISILTC